MELRHTIRIKTKFADLANKRRVKLLKRGVSFPPVTANELVKLHLAKKTADGQRNCSRLLK
jgi:hypothetical protein